jgi:hypothetical protein
MACFDRAQTAFGKKSPNGSDVRTLPAATVGFPLLPATDINERWLKVVWCREQTSARFHLFDFEPEK